MMLTELTTEENRLLAAVGHVTGLMEQKHKQLDQCGVFHDYARVHAGYAALAAGGNPEALKRALFVQWYAVSEPPCFSGLFDLEPEAQHRLFELLDRLASTDGFDAELRWMLPHYYAISDWYFNSLEGLPALKRWIGEHPSRGEFPDAQVRDAALDQRGQMSDYWYRPDHVPYSAP